MTDRTEPRPCPVCRTPTTLEMNDDGVWEYIPVPAEAAQGAAPRAEGLEREASAATPSLLDVKNLARDLRGRVSNLPEAYGGFGLVRRTEVDDVIVMALREWAARLDEGSATPREVPDDRT